MAKSPDAAPRRRRKGPEAPGPSDVVPDTVVQSETIDTPASEEVLAETAAEKAAAENAPEELEFVRIPPGSVEGLSGYKFYVVDQGADPENSVVEPGTGKRLREATDEENNARIAQQTAGTGGATRAFAARPPRGPRQSRNRQNSEASAVATVPTAEAAPESTAPAEGGEAAPAADAEAAAVEPSANEDVDGLLRNLAARPLEERRRIVQELRGSITPNQSEQQENPDQGRTQGDPTIIVVGRSVIDQRGADNGAGPATPEAAGGGGGNGIRGTEAIRNDAGGGRERRTGADRWKFNERDYVGIEKIPLKTLLADPVHSQFFAEKLRSLISDDLDIAEPEMQNVIERYTNGVASQDEMSMMAFATNEYLKWNHIWEKLNESLTASDVAFFRKRNVDMRNAVAHVGADDGLDYFKRALRHMAMRNAAGFQAVEEQIRNMHHARDSVKGKILDYKMDYVAGKIGVSRGDLDSVIDLSSTEGYEATKDDIEARLRSRAGVFRGSMDFLDDQANRVLGKIPEVKLPNWLFHGKTVNMRNLYLPGSSRRAAVKMTEGVRGAMKGKLGYTGKMLSDLEHGYDGVDKHLTQIMGNDEVRRQLQHETLKNERDPLLSELGPSSLKQAREAIANVDVKTIETTIREKIAADPRWAGGDSAYRDSAMTRMKQDVAREQKKGIGFWAWFFNALFAKKVDDAAKKARAPEPTHT